VQHWLVAPTEASNEAEVNQTTQFLKSLTGSDPKKHFLETRFFFWSTHMTKAQEAAMNPASRASVSTCASPHSRSRRRMDVMLR
jgi:hypothetical protein